MLIRYPALGVKPDQTRPETRHPEPSTCEEAMPLSVKDVRFTTRRAGDGDPLLYPRLLKDAAILASIDVATQYFETMVGEERRALDPEALVHFFGDYKVARGMVASLGRVYRYRTPSVEELVTRTAWQRLQRAGLEGPGALRVLLWDHAN